MATALCQSCPMQRNPLQDGIIITAVRQIPRQGSSGCKLMAITVLVCLPVQRSATDLSVVGLISTRKNMSPPSKEFSGIVAPRRKEKKVSRNSSSQIKKLHPWQSQLKENGLLTFCSKIVRQLFPLLCTRMGCGMSGLGSLFMM